MSNQEPLDLDNLCYVCSCGNEDYISLEEFKEICHCGACNGKTRKLTYACVKQQFEIYNRELLSTGYNGRKGEVRFKCPCDELVITTYDSFIASNTKCCRPCSERIGGKKIMNDYETVKNKFADAGCTLISKEYHGCEDLLEFICSCGKLAKLSYHAFQRSPRCQTCGIESRNDSFRLSYEYVKEYFENHGCILKSETYINSQTNLEYICSCGRESTISFSSFKNGRRCGCIKSRGELLISSFLSSLNIKFKPQHTYDDCRNINKLPFDFIVYINDLIILLLEFDGEQHFMAIKKFGGEAKFQQRVKCDNIKNRYCITNNIPILRISYREFKYIEFIISIYISMLKANVNPPIMFTNRTLYENQHNAVKDLLYPPAPKRPTVIDQLYDNTIEITYRNVFMPLQ